MRLAEDAGLGPPHQLGSQWGGRCQHHPNSGQVETHCTIPSCAGRGKDLNSSFAEKFQLQSLG